MNLSCEDIRDAGPDLIAGRLSAGEAHACRVHIAGCGDCAAELELIRSIARYRVSVPTELHECVVAELSPRRRWARLRRTYMGIAATVALLLLGGRVFLSTTVDPDGSSSRVAEERKALPGESANSSKGNGPGWITVDGALNSGAATLGDLSEEQLKQLLAELES